MSNNKTENRQLTAAQLALVTGGSVDMFLKIDGVIAQRPTDVPVTFSWSEHQTAK
jgi:hypothetical protein